MPNRRHVYPLLQARFVSDPRLFLCPAGGGVPMPREQVAGRNDFAEARNVNYAYFNMAGARPSLADNPALPIVSDDNPMFDEDGVPLGPLGWGDRTDRNSRAHGGAGQNILTLDGHVKWEKTPNAGIDGDNIWTLQGVKDYTGHEGPQSATDAHLIR
jgi:prepilin-type processing-associated H-X9-DG protein